MAIEALAKWNRLPCRDNGAGANSYFLIIMHAYMHVRHVHRGKLLVTHKELA